MYTGKSVGPSLHSLPLIVLCWLSYENFSAHKTMQLTCSTVILFCFFKQIRIRFFILFCSLLFYLTIRSGYFSRLESNSIILMAAQFWIYRNCIILFFCLSQLLFPSFFLTLAMFPWVCLYIVSPLYLQDLHPWTQPTANWKYLRKSYIVADLCYVVMP